MKEVDQVTGEDLKPDRRSTAIYDRSTFSTQSTTVYLIGEQNE